MNNNLQNTEGTSGAVPFSQVKIQPPTEPEESNIEEDLDSATTKELRIKVSSPSGEEKTIIIKYNE